MNKKTLILIAEHSKLCISSYLDLLHDKISKYDYVAEINSHTSVYTDIAFGYHSLMQINLDEYMKAKSELMRIHIIYVKKGNIYG